MEARLKKLYNTTLKQQLKSSLKLENDMQVPRIEKIVVNCGVKDAVQDSKVLQGIKEIIEKITGQTAVKTKARVSIAAFKLRKGAPIGVMVTLRGARMYYFLDKLINLVFPAVRDFQGIQSNLDGNGNYSVGIGDWMVFPEVDYDKVDKSRGLLVTICTSAKDDHSARELLKIFNMPFTK